MGNNINLPYSSYINGGVREGMELVISGTPKVNCDRFSVNFCSGPTPDHGDVAFHFNPRLNQGRGCVVRNHKTNNAWGPEETAGTIPFKKGQYFTMQIQTRNQGYKVLVNNNHFCDFTSRIPHTTVQHLFINGDVTLHEMHLKNQDLGTAVPSTTLIHGGVYDGLDIMISGTPKQNSDRFAINLCTGSSSNPADVPLHFNPRFSQGCVVRNHLQGGRWGQEETSGGMPFVRGRPFTITLEVNNFSYKVLVNNSYFCDFTHRMVKEMVQTVQIKGDVDIHSVQFYQRGFHPEGAQHFGAMHGTQVNNPHFGAMHGTPVNNPVVPVITPIHGGFSPGRIIHIVGVPGTGSGREQSAGTGLQGILLAGAQLALAGKPKHRFHINLACGSKETSDLALHFDVRFNFGGDRNVVVRTHRRGGHYGTEERRQPCFPFVPNAKFEMMILSEANCFKVAVNNQHFIEFNHRVLRPDRADHLQIGGDVTIHQIRFQ